mmetsp:Transcript_36892/g.59887  ORF Transcript_36892/g.59887 Transcript_36892/m.59887 type:complete len:203 (-) Transcript_36892:3953-4561(-)
MSCRDCIKWSSLFGLTPRSEEALVRLRTAFIDVHALKIADSTSFSRVSLYSWVSCYATKKAWTYQASKSAAIRSPVPVYLPSTLSNSAVYIVLPPFCNRVLNSRDNLEASSRNSPDVKTTVLTPFSWIKSIARWADVMSVIFIWLRISSSNWFGVKIEAIGMISFLYTSTSASGTYSFPLSPRTGSQKYCMSVHLALSVLNT